MTSSHQALVTALLVEVARSLESGSGQYGWQRRWASINFFASIHESLSVMTLRLRSKALSLMEITGGAVVEGGMGANRSEEESELALGCARGMKDGDGETVVEVLNLSRGTADDALLAPPMDCEPVTKAPPPMEPLPLKVSGDIPP
jgi:hypothetical protein